MNKIYLVFSMLLLMFAFESCQDRTVTDLESDSVVLSLEVKAIEFEGVDSVYTKQIKYWTNRDSTYVDVQVLQHVGDTTWCTAELDADSKILIEVFQNSSMTDDRSAEIIVTSGVVPNNYAIDTIQIYQNSCYEIADIGVYLAGTDNVTGEAWEGVIFDVDSDYEYCKIVSINDKYVGTSQYNWIICSTLEEANVVTGATDKYDGSVNQATILALDDYTEEKYPLFAWADSYGPGWYIPASEELKVLLKPSSVTTINLTFVDLGYALGSDYHLDDDSNHDSYYWSSTECINDPGNVYVTYADIDDDVCYTYGFSKLSSSITGRRHCAIKKVKVPDDMKPLR